MIPCPYCDREFEKRAGLMRHVTSSHASASEADLAYPPADAARLEAIAQLGEPVPTNPGGAIESVVPVDDGQTFSVGPQADGPYVGIDGEPRVLVDLQDERTINPANGVQAPNPEQYKRIRALIRQGRTETEAWMTVVGFEPPPRPSQPVDGRPLRLQQVAFRVRNTEIDQIDASWLLRLAEIGADAIAQLQHAVDSGLLPLSWENADANPIIERWNEAIA